MKKVYNERAIWIACFLGGPLAGAYILAKNFFALDLHSHIVKIWIYSWLFYFAMIGLIIMDPPWLESVPQPVIPWIYLAALVLVFKKFQESRINEFKSAGNVYSLWRATGIGMLGLVITLFPIVGIAYWADDTTIQTFGDSRHEIAFHSRTVQSEQVMKLGSVLEQIGVFTDSNSVSIFFENKDDEYIIFFLVVESWTSDSDGVNYMTALRDEIQKFYPNNKIVITIGVEYPKVLLRIDGKSSGIAEKPAYNMRLTRSLTAPAEA